ncbi:conserved oligomeric Golgi complex subunit 1 isoform X2 [Topomyia yanbarensis]|uniref:conserved oligomeric Golgi complex subunit 1 isoform X2 n=1 Tax=Topomyia yanbarensis TaxID=2498891 RepID=UPI00273C3399|nr:conserved oligomeric Golgi complex subunit 1 isoform X2 [Topomyia yanbarensis]
MAKATNLLNINVDNLFEQHSITDIDQIHKQLQAEVELKREELRTMVGERYRDLLKAADTIGDMKTTASSIIGNIDNITAVCRQLNEHQLIGFRSGAQKKNVSNKFYGILVQIKLLTNLPEMIWSAIDNEDYFVATQLFIFSRHISTGLQLDSNNEVMAKFSVAKKQWAVLSQFFFTIKQNCANCLEREDLRPEVAAKCLASMLLLENCQLEQILNGFVQMRLKAFSGVLSDSSKNEKVKDKIVASLKVLMNTVDLINRCFIGTGQEAGLLMMELTSVTGESSLPTISLIRSEDPKIIQTLPDIICKFRPRLQLQSLNTEMVRNSSQYWLLNVEKIALKQLASFMDLVPTIKMLHDIRTLCLRAAEKPEQWSETCKKLSLTESLDFYNLFYQPLINARAKSIIKSCWSETVESNCNDILELIRTASTDKSLKNMKYFVWSESADDNPLNLKDALDRSNLASHQLLMKSRAIPPSLVKLASLLDERVQALTDEVSSFLKSSNDSEVDHLTVFYSDSSVESVFQLITSIKSAEYKQTGDSFIILARLLIAFKELCPSLKQCVASSKFAHTTPWHDDDNLQMSSKRSFDLQMNNWTKISGLLDEESLRFWKLWIDEFEKKWPQLDQHAGYATVLVDFPLWDIVAIEENDEQNQPVQSTIRVPALPSFSLQKLLHTIATHLSSFIPHTIPKSIVTLIVDKTVARLYNHYRNLSALDFIQKNQNSALQYYFDLKFIQLLFTGREKKQFNDDYNQLIDTFKSYIDPFDFDVFHSHVNTNVKRAVQRMQHFFGVMIVNGDQFSTIQSSTVGTSAANVSKLSQDKNPNILALSSNSASETWFPLLPIVTKEMPTATTAVVELVGFADKPDDKDNFQKS